MVTYAQAQERAEEWINGDVPSYQHREVRVREFELGFVVWAEDRAEGPRSDGGRQRLVIARDSGEATLWPALPVGEVVRRYEEEYGRPETAAEPAAAAPPARVDLNQTSFLLSPPEWLQEAADKLGIPDRRGESGGTSGGPAAGGAGADAGPGPGVGPARDESLPQTQAGVPVGAAGGTGSGAPGAPNVPPGATPWAGTDTNADAEEDRSVPLPVTVFAPPLSGADDTPPPPSVASDAKTALMEGGSRLPRTAVAPALDATGAPAPQAGPPSQGSTPPPGSTPSPSPAAGPAAPPPPPPPGASYGYPAAPGAPGAPAGPGVPPPPPVGSTPPPAGGTPPLPPAPQAGAPYGYPQNPGAPGTPPPPPPPPGGAPYTPAAPAPGRPLAPNAGDIADAATSKAAPPPRRGHSAAPTPPPPGAPGAPGARPGPDPAAPPPGAPAAPGGYAPTQLVSSLGPDGPEAAPQPPGAPQPPAAPGAPGGTTPPGGVHHAATMLADPGRTGGGAPQPPGPPGAPGAPGAPKPPPAPGAPAAPGVPGPPQAPAAPGVPGGGQGGVHHAATMLAPPPPGGPAAPPPPPPPPGATPPPGQPPVPGPPVPGAQPPAYGYPPQGQPTVGPGYQAVLRYRAQDGSEQQLIRRSAPGTPHPEWQIFHELRGMNVPPDQVLELHTELESCQLPGAYCARMIREQWPQARITSIAPYGTDHASRQQGMRQLLAHQGELHQVADGPARPAPVRAPLPPVQPAPPLPPEAIAQELGAAFGPGVFRFEQAAVSRQGVPPVVAHTLVVAGLPLDMGPFFWAQAQPGRPVPTLAELAAERGVQPAPDAGSYLVMGSDFGKALCVQYGTANIVAVPVEAGPGGTAVPPQFVNTGLPEFARCLALLGRMWRLRHGLNQEQAGRWTVDFQAQLVALDPAALGSPESWWSVLLEQMWDGLL
ncbi:SUKH-4 family immunity protein [Streptomyces sp. NPDC058319]|uniref:SUKH-4 family immunity protein n=2 Tax=unclassified Streptomyces TaxID=2593676 RepID=UPI0037D06118